MWPWDLLELTMTLAQGVLQSGTEEERQRPWAKGCRAQSRAEGRGAKWPWLAEGKQTCSPELHSPHKL